MQSINLKLLFKLLIKFKNKYSLKNKIWRLQTNTPLKRKKVNNFLPKYTHNV